MSSGVIVRESYYSQSAWISTGIAPSGYFGFSTLDVTAKPEVDVEEIEAWMDRILEILPKRVWRKFSEDIGKTAFLVRANCSLEPLLDTLANWEATAEEMSNERNSRAIVRASREIRRGKGISWEEYKARQK